MQKVAIDKVLLTHRRNFYIYLKDRAGKSELISCFLFTLEQSHRIWWPLILTVPKLQLMNHLCYCFDLRELWGKKSIRYYWTKQTNIKKEQTYFMRFIYSREKPLKSWWLTIQWLEGLRWRTRYSTLFRSEDLWEL